MNRIDQCSYVLEQIAACYGKFLDSNLFCKNIHDFSMCENPNGEVRVFVKKMISNIKPTELIEGKKGLFLPLPKKRGH